MKRLSIDICDFHAHILPGADHGSSNLKTSIRQLSLAQGCGVCRVVASPHFYAHMEGVSAFIERRNAAYELLKPQISDGVSLALGAEILLCENMENLPGLSELTIGGSNVLLIELPYGDLSDSCLYTVSQFITRGYRVVLAHAERYDAQQIDELIDIGAQIQLNSDAMKPRFFKAPSVKRWLELGLVTCIGSDIHGASNNAYMDFVCAVNRNKRYINNIKENSDLLWSQFKAE